MGRLSNIEPAYRALLMNDQLRVRAQRAYQHMSNCDLCARYCHVDRYAGIEGAVCRTGVHARVHSHGPHQYHPCYRAIDNPPLDRDLQPGEYREVLELANKFRLKRFARVLHEGFGF